MIRRDYVRSLKLTGALILGSFTAIASIITEPPVQVADAAGDAAITVQVTGIHSTKGQIMLKLWNAPEGFPAKSENGYKAMSLAASKAVNGVVTATFSVVPGTYAITTFHDENSNGKMDSNALGIPKEGYGASNNPVTHFHAPSYDQAKFQVLASGQKISIAMRY